MATFTIKPIRIRGRKAESVEDLADAIIDESDEHVRRTPLAHDDQREDFQLSCDALNYWRMRRRLDEEEIATDLETVERPLIERICKIRGYDPEEFGFALSATKDRARTAFGLSPLEQACLRGRNAGFRLLVEELQNSEIATAIAATAWSLQQEAERANILLPIEQLRAVLNRRKIVISGAVRRLVECGVFELVTERYHTGRAREYRFVGEPGVQFELGRSDDEDDC